MVWRFLTDFRSFRFFCPDHQDHIMTRQVPLTVGRSTLLLVLLCAPKANADNCLLALLQSKTCVPDCVRTYCCDDYCSKQVPLARGTEATCCKNYCKKPIPNVQRTCTVCDDYCRKCLPRVPCPPRKLTCTKDFSCRPCEKSPVNLAVFNTDFFRK